MTDLNIQKFPISFDGWYAFLSRVVLVPPGSAYILVSDSEVTVRMGWAFRSCFPKAMVVSTARSRIKTLSRGVHGFSGRWLVNGSGRNILEISLKSAQRAFVLGYPIRLRHLMVSVNEPDALAAALEGSARSRANHLREN